MNEKKLKLADLRFLNDYSKTISFLIKNNDELQLIEFILKEPYPFILTRNIYNLIEKKYDEIKSMRILTNEEERIFDTFHKNYEEIITYFDSISNSYKDEAIKRMRDIKQSETLKTTLKATMSDD